MKKETNSFEIYAYIRVSSKDQNIDRQLVAIQPYDVPVHNVYIEKQSGKDFKRPVYRRLMRRLKKGNVLLIYSIDRLGRNYDEILEQWRFITKEKQADIVVLDFPLLDTRDRSESKDLTGRFIADLVLQILAYVAQKERENIRQRQAEGIAAAKAKGKKWGRPKTLLPEQFYELYPIWEKGELSTKKLIVQCDMKRSTFYKYFKAYRDTLDDPLN